MSMKVPGPYIALLVFLACQAACRAQAFVEHLSPPALERGKTTRVTVVGSQLQKASAVWTSLPAGKAQATPVGESKGDAAVFDVKVAEDTPVGLFGMRVATADGLSN